ncbi:MAG: cobalamin-dependent protein, partial [Planctomycetota bacterium]|nr:cobalamin-dependent protein [Planctomycetota bacterium]
GHDVGAKIVCRALIEAGMEVVYTGLRKSPEFIAETAVSEDAAVLGLSVLSGAHLPLTAKVSAALAKLDAQDLVLIAGGNIPAQDHAAMAQLGVKAVFPTSTPLDEIVAFVQQAVAERNFSE